MGLLNKDERSKAGGSIYAPAANDVVTLKSHRLEKGGKYPDGKDWYRLVVDMDWDGKPDDFTPRFYIAGDIEVKGNKALTQWRRNQAIERYVDSIVSALDAANPNGVELEDSDDFSIFDGLQVNMSEFDVLDKNGKPVKQKDKSGKETEFNQQILLVTKILGMSDSQNKSGKKVKPAEMDATTKAIVQAKVDEGDTGLASIIGALAAAKITPDAALIKAIQAEWPNVK